MNGTLTILGIPGSLRRASYNRAALIAAQGLLPAGTRLDIFDLEGLPMFNQDKEAQPAPRVVAFKDAIRGADAILFATPEYNYSMSGVLKNAIDCASRPYGDSAWEGKPVAVMGASVSMFGTMRAQNHLRQTFVSLDMHPVNEPEVMIDNAGKAFDKQGLLVDEASRKLIRQLLENLAHWARQLEESSGVQPAALQDG
ncbi:MAG: NAD(P)H-dependent oxidoreductase [Casimicrobiaceae bacterium]